MSASPSARALESKLPRRRAWLSRRPHGRILAVKWGYNPNSSSLGVDVTFLLFGMAAVVLLTPLVALVLRARSILGGASGSSVPGSAERSQTLERTAAAPSDPDADGAR